jgi:hypothetical protein
VKPKLALPILATCVVMAFDVGGVRQPAAEAYFSAVQWAMTPFTDNLVESVQDIQPEPEPVRAAP